MKVMRLIGYVGVALLATSVAACKGGSGGDDGDTGSNKSFTIGNFTGEDDDNQVYNGECFGFTVTGVNTAFADGSVQLQIDWADGTANEISADIMVINSVTEIVIGDPCILFGPGFPEGATGLTIADGTDIISLPDAFTITATPVYDMGAATNALGGADSTGATDARYNALTRPGDHDFYGYSAAREVVGYFVQPDAGSDLIPVSRVYNDAFSQGYADGGYMALRDVSTVTSLPASLDLVGRVLDYNIRGAATGYEYTVYGMVYTAASQVTDVTGGTGSVGDSVDTTGDTPYTISTAGMYRGRFTGGATPTANNYDPMGGAAIPSSGAYPDSDCVAQMLSGIATAAEPALPMYADGRDVVFQLDIPDGQTAYIGVQSEGDINDAEGNHGDLVMYAAPTSQVLPSDAVTTFACTAGADLFGPVGTDSMRISNTSGSTASYWLVIDQFSGQFDSASVSEPDVDFLLWVLFI